LGGFWSEKEIESIGEAQFSKEDKTGCAKINKGTTAARFICTIHLELIVSPEIHWCALLASR
jgi:hypothetical protein